MRGKAFAANPVVSCREEEDGSVLFNPDTDDMAVINPTGRVIWDFLATPRTPQEVASHLVERFRGVSPDEAEADVERFLETLVPDFILEVEETDDG